MKSGFLGGDAPIYPIAYLDGLSNLEGISTEEKELVEKAKKAINTGKFQQLQRDINKLRTAVKKTPIHPVVLLEKAIKILAGYPLEHVELNTIQKIAERQMNYKKEITPEIIISESFNS